MGGHRKQVPSAELPAPFCAHTPAPSHLLGLTLTRAKAKVLRPYLQGAETAGIHPQSQGLPDGRNREEIKTSRLWGSSYTFLQASH